MYSVKKLASRLSQVSPASHLTRHRSSDASFSSSNDSLYSDSCGCSYEPTCSSTHSTPVKPRLSIKPRSRPTCETCCLCQEPLAHVFDGEDVVDLTCGHLLHFSCFAELSSDGSTETDPDDPLAHIVCPECGEPSSCNRQEISDDIIQYKLLGGTDGIDAEFILSDPGLTADFNYTPIVAEKSTTPVPPINTTLTTPTEQIGEQFWISNHGAPLPEAMSPHASSMHSSDSATKPLFNLGVATPLTPTPASPASPFTPDSPATTCVSASNSSLSEAQVAKVSLAPEKTVIETATTEVPCVINFRTANFEPLPVALPKEDRVITEINKGKVTNGLLTLFESRLSQSEIERMDLANVGYLILFDIMDSVSYSDKQYGRQTLVVLFEKCLIILSVDCSEIAEVHKLSPEDPIASVFSDESTFTVIVTFKSLSVQDLSLQMGSKIAMHKWYNVFRMFEKGQSHISDHIPLIQVSTNAWTIFEGDEDMEDAVPEGVSQLQKIVSKGLDLPFDLINRQIPQPERDPISLVLALPMCMPPESDCERSVYISRLKEIIRSTTKSLRDDDKISLLFLGKNPNDEELGSYYGPLSVNWMNWDMIFDSMSENSLSEDDPPSLQWTSGVGLLGRLSSLMLAKGTINQIIFVTSDILSEDLSVSRAATPKAGSSISSTISNICREYNATFHSVLLADEDKYEIEQIRDHHSILCNVCPGGYSNVHVEHLAVDSSELQQKVSGILIQLEEITVQKITATLKCAPGHTISSVDSCGEFVDLEHGTTEFTITLTNLPPGYSKTLLFAVQLDPTTSHDVRKLQLINSETSIVASGKMTLFSNSLEVKVDDTGDTVTQPMTIISNLPIVSRLSAVQNAYFLKRKVEMQVIKLIKETIFGDSDFSYLSKEKIRAKFKGVMNHIWELSHSCNHSNTANFGNGFRQWSAAIIESLEEMHESYSMRNYQLANYRSFEKYLELI